MLNYGPLPGLGLQAPSEGSAPEQGRAPSPTTPQAPLEVRQTQETNPDANALWREMARIIFQNIPPEKRVEEAS